MMIYSYLIYINGINGNSINLTNKFGKFAIATKCN